MKNIRTQLFTFITAGTLIAAAGIFTGCSKKTNTDRTAADRLTVTDNSQTPIERKESWHSTNKKIAIVFGYGYNTEEFVKGTMSRLEKKYGIADETAESGLILPLIFPDDFKVGGTTRISRLNSKIDGIELCGLITLGAPENTNKAIGALQEDYSNNMPYPVYTFFPQDDDIVGIQATSDFIVDKSTSADKLEEDKLEEEYEQTMVEGIDQMIDRSIEYMLLTDSPLPSDKDLEYHVKKIVGEHYKLKRYIDAETGLQSVNHFIID